MDRKEISSVSDGDLEEEPVRDVGEKSCEISPPEGAVAALLALGLMCALGAYIAAPVFSPGCFFNITVGRWILSHRALPHMDFWTLAAFGHYWQTTTWLFDCLVALVYDRSAEKGLVVFKVSAFLLYGATLYFVFSRRSKSRFIGTLLGLFVLAATLAYPALDPVIFAWVFFLLMLELSFTAASSAPRGSFLVSAYVLSAIYANFHASAVFGAVSAGSIFFFEKGDKHSRAWTFSYISAIVLGLFSTPYFVYGVTYPFVYFRNTLAFELLTRANPGTVYSYSFSLLILLWLVFAVIAPRKNLRLHVVELVLSALGAVFAMASLRFVSFALLLLALLVSSLLGEASDAASSLEEGLCRLRSKLEKIPAVGVIWIAIVVVIINVAPLLETPILRPIFPERELDYLAKKREVFPVLHSRSFGAYVIFRFSNSNGEPRDLASVDDRIEEISPALAKDELALSKLSYDWREFFGRISPKAVLCRAKEPLCSLLMADSSWKLVLSGGREVTGDPEHSLPSHSYSWMLFLASSGVSAR